MTPRGCLTALAGVAALLVGGQQTMMYLWRMGAVPNGLNAPVVLYAKEKSWGFGPGGNESGVVIYRLTDGSARKVAKGGVPTSPPRPTAASATTAGRTTSGGRRPSATTNNGPPEPIRRPRRTLSPHISAAMASPLRWPPNGSKP